MIRPDYERFWVVAFLEPDSKPSVGDNGWNEDLISRIILIDERVFI